MERRCLLAGCLLIALAPWTAHPQDPPREGSDTQEDLRSPAAVRRRLDVVRERFEGAWQLTRATLRGLTLPHGANAGYMLVMPDYLAIEIHLEAPPLPRTSAPPPFFQSGMSRWRLTAENQIETFALIGNTNMNPDDAIRFEPPGNRRMLVATISESMVVLERPGESRLEFRRLPGLPFPGRRGEKEKTADSQEDQR